MRWERLERIVNVPHLDSGIIEVRKVVGWECSACHHINWSDRMPDGGCWECGARDEAYGKDAPRREDVRPGEALKITSPSKRTVKVEREEDD